MVGGTFIGGIHTAAAGGTYQLAVQGFGGLGFRDDALQINPALPPGWEAIEYPVTWRGNRLRIRARHDRIDITAANANPGHVDIAVRGVPITVNPGTTATIAG
jgi:trehalose/maltose hydrolase-like predicted phosphorylase